MAQSNNPITGISYLFKALPLLTQKGIKSYVIIPLIINILFFSVGIYFGFAYFAEYMDKFGDRCLQELKLESPTLHDDPTTLILAILNLNTRRMVASSHLLTLPCRTAWKKSSNSTGRNTISLAKR